MRFAKGMVAGAVGQMALVSMKTPSVWADLKPLLLSLGLAFVFGALTGLVLALEKWSTWEE